MTQSDAIFDAIILVDCKEMMEYGDCLHLHMQYIDRKTQEFTLSFKSGNDHPQELTACSQLFFAPSRRKAAAPVKADIRRTSIYNGSTVEAQTLDGGAHTSVRVQWSEYDVTYEVPTP